MTMNKAILCGRLGADPELRTTNSGMSVCNFNIATDSRWTDKQGQRQEKTEWHKIVVWGAQGENCNEYLYKGRMVIVEGEIQTREWDDKDGNKRTTTEIKALSVQFLPDTHGPGDRPAKTPPRTPPRTQARAQPKVADPFDDPFDDPFAAPAPASAPYDDDDIPF